MFSYGENHAAPADDLKTGGEMLAGWSGSITGHLDEAGEDVLGEFSGRRAD